MTTQALEVIAVAATTPAAKSVKAKPAAKTAPAAKKTTASKAKPKAATGVAYSLMAGVRPTSGANLYAHTQAVLELTGMLKGKGAKKALLSAVMGETAVRYNIKEGKFSTDDSGDIVLTAGGAAQFAARKFAQADVDSFKALLSTGTPNDLCKNADFIRKLA